MLAMANIVYMFWHKVGYRRHYLMALAGKLYYHYNVGYGQYY